MARDGTAREMSRAASKDRQVNQSQHCHISSCFQRGQVEEHERVFFCETALSKEAPLDRIDSRQYGAGRVVHDWGAILHEGPCLRFVHLDQPREFMEAPGPDDCGIVVSFQEARLTVSRTHRSILSLQSNVIPSSLNGSPCGCVWDTICTDSFAGSNKTWFAFHHLCSSV